MTNTNREPRPKHEPTSAEELEAIRLIGDHFGDDTIVLEGGHDGPTIETLLGDFVTDQADIDEQAAQGRFTIVDHGPTRNPGM